MNQENKSKFTQKLLPHGVAIVVFLSLTVAYFYPAFQGYSIKQSDIASYIGMAKEHNDFRDATGEEALWTNSMFGGMPTFQIDLIHKANLLSEIDLAVKSVTPHGVIMAFYYFLGFYILLLCMRINSWLAIVGAIAFAYSSYFYIILEAGHLSKAQAIGLMAPVLGAVILVYRGKFFLGSVLFAFFFGFQLVANHYQITFYFSFVLLFYAVFQLFKHFKEKELSLFFKKSSFLVLAGLLAIGANSGRIITTYEYAKETIRGKTELSSELLGKNKAESTGLSTDYITQWSYGIGESYSLFVPNVKGGASGALLYDDVVNFYQGRGKEKREAKKKLDEVDEDLKNYVIAGLQQGKSVNTYWGNQPFTSGPVYIGAIVIFLFCLSFLLWKSSLKWFFLGLIILATALSWGKNFMPLTQWFIENVPLYNKFRAVSMLLVLVEFLVPIIAIVAVDKIIKDKNLLIEKQQSVTYLIGGFFALALLIIAAPENFFSFLSAQETVQFSQSNNTSISKTLIDYRIGEFRADAFRSLGFVLAAILLLYFYSKNQLKQNLFIGILGVFILADMWSVDKRFLNNEKRGKDYISWQKTADKNAPHLASSADKWILQNELEKHPELNSLIANAVKEKERPKGMDKQQFEESVAFGVLNLNSNYRVYKLGGNSFQESGTSYFHKSIGGYHAAKLKRYQELIDFAIEPETRKLSQLFSAGVPNAFEQLPVLNMLNMRYLIFDPNQQAIENPSANGNAWFVDSIIEVANPDEEILALSTPGFNSKREVIIQRKFLDNKIVPTNLKLNQGTINMLTYTPNEITYHSSNSGNGLAVFSEVYYSKGWKVFIDNKESDYSKANYVLRALFIPAGEHEIRFVFKPTSFYATKWISYLCSFVIVLLVGFVAFKAIKRETTNA